MRLITLFFLVCLSINSAAQKHDQIWKFNNSFNNHAYYPTYQLDFNRQDSVYFDSLKTTNSLGSSAAFFSDSAGQLLFQTSGCFIADSNGDTLIDGAEIGINSKQYNDYCPYGSYEVWQYGLFLPFPKRKDSYYFIHLFGDTYVTAVKYAVIEKEGPKYRVTKKNEVLVKDEISIGGFMANKHANGRDWWIVAMRKKSNKIYKFLLDPEGIHDLGYQEIGVPLQWSRHSEVVFSPDGTLLAQANPADDLRLWDFDRGTGMLSNPRHYPHQDTADVDNQIIAGGMAFSHDGTKIYRGNELQLYQYDLKNQNVEASITEIARYKGDRTNGRPDLVGGIMELGPDGRIYIMPASGTTYTMHRINHPERQAAECGFEYQKYYFHKGYAAMTMFPNYRLGPIDGSPSDTLGLNNYPLAGFRYDRLAGLLVDFTSVSWYEPQTWLWHFGDPASGANNTSTDLHPSHVFTAPGYYTVCLTVSNQYGVDTLCKQVYIDASVDAQEPQLTETEQGVLVYPNPACTWVEVLLPRSVSGNMQLYDVSGAKVLEQSLENTNRARMQVSDLPAGVYAWALREASGKVWSGKVAVVR
jgi:PKD domain/Secretion system C-terminal sorting domain